MRGQLPRAPSIQVSDFQPGQADSSRFRFKCNYQMSLDLPSHHPPPGHFPLFPSEGVTKDGI